MTVPEASPRGGRRRGGSHVLLAATLVAGIGMAFSVAAWRATSEESERLAQAQQQADTDTVLTAVQTFLSGVDRVLVDARLDAAADGLDPSAFIERSEKAIRASPSVAGFALFDQDGLGVIARAGSTSLLDRRADPPGTVPTLIGFAQDASGFRYGFSEGTPGTAFVYVELLLPAPSRDADTPGFAIASSEGNGAIILANASVGDNLLGPVESLSVGGVPADLYIEPLPPPRQFGVPVAALVLLVGAVITAGTTTIFVVAYRRRAAIASLRRENAALDEALARQRALEVELRASEHRWAAVLRDSPDTVALMDRGNFSLELLNRTSFLGHVGGDLSEPEGLWRLLEPDDRRRLAWIGGASSSAHRPGGVDEATVLLKAADGHARWFNLRVTASEIPNGTKPSTLMITFTDVHHRWERQRDRAQLQTSLRVAERMQKVSQRAAGLSHDLRNLLAVIGSSVELLQRRVDDPGFHEDLGPILSAVEKGRRLSKQIMAMAKQERPELIDLNEVVAGMNDVLGRALGDQSELRMSLDPQSCHIIADRSYVEQVLMNLAVNARDAMPRGGILTVRTSIVRDENGAGRSSPRIVLSVTDTGTGIAEQDLDRIFEPYFTTKPRDEGTGLGLAMIKEIVDGMDGSIVVSSTVGTGTEFEISIPQADQSIRPQRGPTDNSEEASPMDHPAFSIPLGLVVDHDPAARLRLGAALDECGFGAVVAENESAARRVATELRPDFVLLSHQPPRTAPSLAFVESLRRDHPDLVIVWVCERGVDQPDHDTGSVVVREPLRPDALAEAVRVARASLVPA